MKKKAQDMLTSLFGEADAEAGLDGITFTWKFVCRLGVRLICWLLSLFVVISWAPFNSNGKTKPEDIIPAVTNAVIPIVTQEIDAKLNSVLKENDSVILQQLDDKHFATEEEVKHIRDKQDIILNKIEDLRIDIATLTERSRDRLNSPHEK